MHEYELPLLTEDRDKMEWNGMGESGAAPRKGDSVPTATCIRNSHFKSSSATKGRKNPSAICRP